MTGEVLAPVLPHTAAAVEAGRIGAEHIKQIREFFCLLPGFVDPDTRAQAEAQLAETACGHTPDGLRTAADRLAGLLNPDGQFSDQDRARRRYLHLGTQQPDGMSELPGRLTPEGRAVLESVQAKLATPAHLQPRRRTPLSGRGILGRGHPIRHEPGPAGLRHPG